MVDLKVIEKNAFEFLKNKFDKVEWLSENSYSPIDFRCWKDNKSFLIECKYCPRKKVHLNPYQKIVDAVILFIDNEYKLIWKNDFHEYIIFSNSTIIKINANTKDELDKLKIVKKESYDEVIQKLIELNYSIR